MCGFLSFPESFLVTLPCRIDCTAVTQCREFSFFPQRFLFLVGRLRPHRSLSLGCRDLWTCRSFPHSPPSPTSWIQGILLHLTWPASPLHFLLAPFSLIFPVSKVYLRPLLPPDYTPLSSPPVVSETPFACLPPCSPTPLLSSRPRFPLLPRVIVLSG